MHKIFPLFVSLTLLFSVISSIKAEVVYPDQASAVAQNFYYERMVQKGQMVNINDIELVLASEGRSNELPAFYAFDINNGGFVIVSGDDGYTPIIGYSDEGKFPTNYAGSNFGSFLNEYIDQISFLRENRVLPDAALVQKWVELSQPSTVQYAMGGSRDIEPLILSTWNQDYPYNAYCPLDAAGPGGRVYAGCVATAMAMIMHYYRYPEHGTGSHSFNLNPYGNISANFGETWYDWDAMTNSINSNSGEAINAIAELQYQCGVSMDMGYSPDGSGAYSEQVPDAIKTYFGYSSAAQHLYKYYYSASTWEDYIITSLDNLQPLYYSGRNSSGGHAFVLDAYQNTSSGNLFHFNFGWSGSGNGFYTLSDVNGFSSNQGMVRNFFPDPVHYPYGCSNSVITSSRGGFEDNSGPLLNYEPNSHCTWLIQPTDSVVAINLTFDRFELGSGDVVNVYDGSDASAPLLASYNSTDTDLAVSSSGSKLFVEFITDDAENDQGFVAAFSSTYPIFCTSSATTYTEPEGHISDGSGPKNYNNNSICKWKIDPGALANELTLVFTEFDLEENVDFIKIYSIPDYQVLGDFTGSTLPPALVSTTGKMLVIFSSNGYNNAGGFEADYYTLNVSSQDQAFAKNLAIFPNPASGYVNLKFNLDEGANVEFGIFNVMGQQVYNESAHLNSGFIDRTLQFGKLNSGVYVLRISSPKGSISQRLVIE
ncbi:MAG: C10 family peptidase [Lentimicrobium sp.]|jgi:hypothetical protein|nr:C10 family peptidase [Lentimicrobium sp.]